MTPAWTTLPLRRTAKIGGAADQVTYATSVFAEFFVRPTLIVSGDAARTASNIVAHSQLLRVALVSDLLTGTGVVVLNLALYELLSQVHRAGASRPRQARRPLAAREGRVGSAITVSGFIVVSILSGAEYLHAFQPREVQAHVFVRAQSSRNMIVLHFCSLGSTTGRT